LPRPDKSGRGNDRKYFTLTLTLSPQGRGEDNITQWGEGEDNN